MSGKSVSFRSHLIANASDLIAELGLNCTLTTQLISGIVSQLAAYNEEGVPLSPAVFICNSISMLLQRAGFGEHVELSGNISTESAASKILKAAAPLSGHNWRIYIERSPTGKMCRFGVFSGSTDPSSLTVDEVLLDDFEENFPVIRIFQSAINKVEVKTNKGSSVEFRFNDDHDVSHLSHETNLKLFCDIIARSESDHFDAFTNFIRRTLFGILRECHGTLLAVVKNNEKSLLPKALKDSVILHPPLDLHNRFKLHFAEGQTIVSVGRLQAAAELVKGFIQSDGITIFDTSAKIIAFRGFVVNSKKKISESTSGGARTRAFETMSEMIERDELVAAYFRSEDGRTDFKMKAP